MPNQTEKQQRILQQVFKYGNRYMMLPLWRLGLGRLVNFWPGGVGRIMVLMHRGRKSGRVYYAPVNYAPVDDEVYCVAAFGPHRCDWYRNLMAAPQTEVWLPKGHYHATVEDISDSPDRLRLVREVLIASGFAASTFEGIHPRTMSEEELAEVTAAYRLLHVTVGERVTERQAGVARPGDWWGVWGMFAAALGLAGLLRSRRQQPD